MNQPIGGNGGPQDPRQVLDDLTRLADTQKANSEGGDESASQGADLDVDDPAFLANVHKGTRESDKPRYGQDDRDGAHESGGGGAHDGDARDREHDPEGPAAAGREPRAPSEHPEPDAAAKPPQSQTDIHDRGSYAPGSRGGPHGPERGETPGSGGDTGVGAASEDGSFASGRAGSVGFSRQSVDLDEPHQRAEAAENHAPSVASTAASLSEDGSLLITQEMLLAGATDADGDALTATHLSAPTHR